MAVATASVAIVIIVALCFAVCSIETRDLVQMAFDVGCGLEYLHSIDHVHR